MSTNVPVGTILLWDQAVIPTKFALCDGGVYNGITTPDCRNRFVWACNLDSELKGTGGSTQHTHSWTGSTGSEGAHSHSQFTGNTDAPDTAVGAYQGYMNQNYYSTVNHRHSLTIDYGVGGTHTHTMGTVNAASHVPKHVKLCYIMKVEE